MSEQVMKFEDGEIALMVAIDAPAEIPRATLTRLVVALFADVSEAYEDAREVAPAQHTEARDNATLASAASGRLKNGRKIPKRLTSEQKRDLVRDWRSGRYTPASLADAYNISTTTVARFVANADAADNAADIAADLAAAKH